MTSPQIKRQSDRWMTPGVLITMLAVGGLLTGLTIVAVAYLAAQGIDPAPVLDLPAKVGIALGSLGSLWVNISSRVTAAKVEQNTGAKIPAAIDEHTAAIDDLTRTVNAALDYADRANRPASETSVSGYALPPVPVT